MTDQTGVLTSALKDRTRIRSSYLAPDGHYFECASAMALTTQRLYFLPILSFIFSPVAFILIYVIGALNGDVSPWFSTIADISLLPPGRNLFGFVAHIAVFLTILNGIGIYLLLKRIVRKKTSFYQKRRSIALWTNVFGLMAMFASAAGRLTVVNVNKQDDQVLHMAGNLTHFGMSIMMMIAVCAITAYFPTKNYLPTLRKVICVFMIAFFSWYLMHLYFLSKYPIPAQERTPFTTWIGRLHIDPNTPPFSKTVIYMLAIGAFCQWSMIVCEGTFILTYLAEFSSVVVHLAFENRKGIKANKWQQPIKPSVISVGH